MIKKLLVAGMKMRFNFSRNAEYTETLTNLRAACRRSGTSVACSWIPRARRFERFPQGPRAIMLRRQDLADDGSEYEGTHEDRLLLHTSAGTSRLARGLSRTDRSRGQGVGDGDRHGGAQLRQVRRK